VRHSLSASLPWSLLVVLGQVGVIDTRGECEETVDANVSMCCAGYEYSKVDME